MANKKRLCFELTTKEDIKLPKKLKRIAVEKEISVTKLALDTLKDLVKNQKNGRQKND
jgi:hypothetical protein